MAAATKGGPVAGNGRATGKRQQRHDAIRAIIRAEAVRTQRDLAARLQEEGFDCTQATVSRDIMELGLRKSPDGRYLLPEADRLERLVAELAVDVKVGGTIVVVKTLPGGAQGVCAALDDAQLPGALGTVAGDDTIMIAAMDADAADQVAHTIDGLRRR